MEGREKEDLYIPTYVTAQHEYFPGFGKKELYLTILMSAFVNYLVWNFSGSINRSVNDHDWNYSMYRV